MSYRHLPPHLAYAYVGPPRRRRGPLPPSRARGGKGGGSLGPVAGGESSRNALGSGCLRVARCRWKIQVRAGGKLPTVGMFHSISGCSTVCSVRDDVDGGRRRQDGVLGRPSCSREAFETRRTPRSRAPPWTPLPRPVRPETPKAGGHTGGRVAAAWSWLKSRDRGLGGGEAKPRNFTRTRRCIGTRKNSVA